MKKLALVIVVGLIISGCTSGQRADFGALGNEHMVEMYSGGIKVCEWTSTGYVESSPNSDGYFFRDKETKMNIKVSGDVVITTLP